MKTKFLYLLLVLCAILSCDKGESIAVVKEPIDIGGFTHERVLVDGSLAIVNNKEELRQVMPDGYLMYQQKVDFSKGNLLLIFGTSTSGINNIVKKQSKVDGKYNFEITIYQKLTTVLDSWCIAYIIPKNVTKQNIILQIEYQSTEL